MANPKLQKLRQLRRQAAESGNEKRFSNLTNRIRDKRGLDPLSDARKNKMFKRLGGPDNTTFNRRPLPGGGRIMTGPLPGGGGPVMETVPPYGGGKPVIQPVKQPLPGGGRIMTGPQQIQGFNAGQPAGLSAVPGRAVAFKNGGAVIKNSEKKKKKNVNGIAKRGTKFKGVF